MRPTVFLLLAAACGDNLAPDVDDPPVTAGRTITGSQIISSRHLDRSVLSHMPVDLWTAVIEAHLPDGDGWRVVPGSGHRDGSFEIPGVADGPLWLRVARRPFGEAFYWTSADHVSFDESELGPMEPPFADEGDHIALSVEGLAAWQDGDELGWYVPDDLVFDNNLVWANPPAPDTTQLSDSIDWTWRPLADAAPGDAAFLVQYRTQELAPGLAVRAPLRAAQPTLQQLAGIDSTLTATLSTPPALHYHLAWALDAFEAERTAAHPTRAGASYGHSFSLTALPGHVDGELWTGSEYSLATLPDPSVLDGTAPLDLGELAIPNPFPRSWIVDFYAVTFPIDFPLPDGTPVTLEAVLGRRSTELTESGPARPLVTAVRAPTIAGRDAFTTQAGVGLTPEIEWDRPATGTATSYMLQIIEAFPDPPFPYRPGWYLAAQLFVPGDVTAIRVPADVLQRGKTYGIVVRTFAQPGQDITAAPFRQRGTAGFADTILGPFTP